MSNQSELQHCHACDQHKPIDEFYNSHTTRCKACIRADSKRTYERRRTDLQQEYIKHRDQHRADARLNYEANKFRILLQARLRYRRAKTHRTIEDDAVIDELQELLSGTKPQPTACAWCGDARYRLDPHLSGDSGVVVWLCPRCVHEVKIERRKTRKARRRKIKNEGQPKPPRWLKRLLGR